MQNLKLSQIKNSGETTTKPRAKNIYKTTLYSTDVNLLKKTLDELQKIRKISYIRLKSIVKKLCVRKGPCGRGYAVFIKKRLKLHKWVLLFDDVSKLRAISNAIKTPNICVESSLC